MTREHETSLSYLHSLVSDVFNLLEVGLLIRIEHQLLEVHSSQPALNPQPRPRTFASAFPDACRCWTGGCPWTPGATSSLRRRARRRGSERAPRAARARRELEPQTYPRRVKSLHPWSKEKFLVSRYYPLSKFEGNALKLSSRLLSLELRA